MVIFGWLVRNDQFFTLLMSKNLDIPYFEVISLGGAVVRAFEYQDLGRGF